MSCARVACGRTICHRLGMVTAATTSLIGRKEELRRLDHFISGVGEGPGTLVLEGAPGIGKTTLWNAAIQRARERDLHVLEAQPAAPERELSFAALGDLLAGTHDEIGGLPAPQRRALRIGFLLEEPDGEPPEQRAVGAALCELLRR